MRVRDAHVQLARPTFGEETVIVAGTKPDIDPIGGISDVCEYERVSRTRRVALPPAFVALFSCYGARGELIHPKVLFL